MPAETCPFNCGSKHQYKMPKGMGHDFTNVYSCGSSLEHQTYRCQLIIARRKLHALREAVGPFAEAGKFYANYRVLVSPPDSKWEELAKAYEESA